MKRVLLYLALAAVLAAAYGLHEAGLLWAIGGVGTHAGRSFAFTLTLIFLTAVAGTALPRHRLPIILTASLLHLCVVYGLMKAAIAVSIWIAFHALVKLPVSWWLKAAPIAGLFAAPFVLAAYDPDSALIGALTVAFCSTNFTLRSLLYAYKAAVRPEPIERAGLAGYLTCLAAAPLTVVNFAPIGFLVMMRGLRKEDDPSLLRRGVVEIALGVAYLTALHLGSRLGVLPRYEEIADAADHLDVLTALTASHCLLLRFFLKVAGDIHLAVGMLRVIGFDIPSGSERPYLSRNVLDFWRTWNTYYRDFLMTLGYYPVAAALKRRPMLAVAAGGAAAFLLSGFAHALQYFVRHPEDLTLRRLLEAHAWALVFGAFVVAWMIREIRHPRAARPRPFDLRRAGTAAVTLTAVSLMLLLYYPPLSGSGLSTLGGIFKAFLRPPG